MGTGVAFFTMGMVGGVLALMEGVTGLAGEGDQLHPESPEQIRNRLAMIGVLLGMAAVGWVLARLGDAYQKPNPRRPSIARLAAELLLLLGGVDLAAGILFWCSPRSVGYSTPNAYRQAAIAALIVGPVCLGPAWVLLRWQARHSRSAEPSVANGQRASQSRDR